jgi:hypothetical protein
MRTFDEQIDCVLSLPYEEQRRILIVSLRSWGKMRLNHEFREALFKKDPALFTTFYEDPEIVKWMHNAD